MQSPIQPPLGPGWIVRVLKLGLILSLTVPQSHGRLRGWMAIENRRTESLTVAGRQSQLCELLKPLLIKRWDGRGDKIWRRPQSV
jgi:hypothetical protein